MGRGADSLLANLQERLVQTEHGTVVVSGGGPNPTNTGKSFNCFLTLMLLVDNFANTK